MSDLITKLREKCFRMLIFGASESGKSTLLVKEIIPAIKSKYDEFVVFTPEFNKRYYETQFKKMKIDRFHIFTNSSEEIPDMLEEIKQLQMNNIKSYNKEGEPIFKSQILIIFDDIISNFLFNSEEFLQLFFHLRHLFISTILISQVTSGEVNPAMLSNTSFFVIFRVDGKYQVLPMVDIISGAVFKQHPELTFNKVRQEAKRIFAERALNVEYGYIVIDAKRNIF